MKRSLAKNPISFEKTDGGRQEAFPESFKIDKQIGDCVVRATAIATQQGYKEVWDNLFSTAKEIGFFPNHDQVCNKYLLDNGWKEIKFGKECVRMNDERVTEQAKGRFIICYTRKHWVAMKDNTIYDTWNSSTNSMDEYSRVFRIYTK